MVKTYTALSLLNFFILILAAFSNDIMFTGVYERIYVAKRTGDTP